MNLEYGEQVFGRDAQGRSHPAAIFRHMRRIISRPDAAIQPGVNPFGNAAFAAEESVMQAGNGRQQRGLEWSGFDIRFLPAAYS